MDDLGKPRKEIFDPDKWLDLVEQYFNSDEIELGLWLLDHPPSYYRENPPVRATNMREIIHRQLWTPVQYRGIYTGAMATAEEAIKQWSHRYQMVEQAVRAAQVRDQEVHIMELAPGTRVLPTGLAAKGYLFTYESMGLDAQPIGTPPDSAGAVKIFVCFELIEHLANPMEIYQNYLKMSRQADVIMISTPLHTYGGGMPGWHNRELGHLRCYSVGELHAVISKMFPGFTWSATTSDVIVLTGIKT